MEVTADIDWLTCVIPEGWRLQPLDGELPLLQWKPTNGGMGYNRGLLDDLTGMKMYWSTDRPEMGSCYVVSAQPLAKLAELTASASYLFAALRIGLELGEATRLDVRVDIPDKGEAIYELANEVYRGNAISVARRKSVYQGVGERAGITVYFGSKTSDSYVRCYDKNSESHGAKPYSRIEVQLRRTKARAAWRALTGADGAATWSPIIKGIVRAHITSFGVAELDEPFAGSTPFTFSVDKVPEVDRWRWLMKQVLPTFARDALNHRGDPQLWRAFTAELMKRLNRE